MTFKTEQNIDIEKLREELKIDEGVKYEIYLDHLGLPSHDHQWLLQYQDQIMN